MENSNYIPQETVGRIQHKALLGLVYILLLLLCGMSTCSWLGLAGIVALAAAIFLKRKSRAEDEVMDLMHASWQLNTLFIFIGLGLLWIGAILGFIIYLGQNQSLLDQITAILGSGVDPVAMLGQIWALKVSKVAAVVFIGLFIPAFIWPLMRTIKGMIALFTNTAPGGWGVRHWISLIIAIALEYLYWMVIGALHAAGKIG